MRSDATTSQGKQKPNGSGRWRHRLKRQQRTKRTSCRGGTARGGMTRGIVTASWCVERWLQVRRMGGKGCATRSNMATSQRKQNANGRREVEVAHHEAGTCQEDKAAAAQ
jgi:hypothetical protein